MEQNSVIKINIIMVNFKEIIDRISLYPQYNNFLMVV